MHYNRLFKHLTLLKGKRNTDIEVLQHTILQNVRQMHIYGNVIEANFSCMSQQGERNSKHAYLFTLTSAINQIFNLIMFEHENNTDAKKMHVCIIK